MFDDGSRIRNTDMGIRIHLNHAANSESWVAETLIVVCATDTSV
jgi:hypothetical protein